MMRRLLLLVFAWFVTQVNAPGAPLGVEQLKRVEYEQRLGATIPLDTGFVDEKALPVRLGQYFGSRPVILVLADYKCPTLCTVVLTGLLESVRNLRMDAGSGYEVVVVNLRPGADPKLAEAKKHTYATRYGRPGSAKGWHFLQGKAESIQKVADAVGFHFQYEEASGQYAHPSGIVVLSPAGKVSRYFLGIEYAPEPLREALVAAGQEKTGSLANRLLLLCFHYDPATGRYSLLVSRLLKVFGVGTALGLGTLVLTLYRRERRLATSSE